MATVSVGVIANPASGRDVRRLVTGASVFDNAEKGAMVHRLMAGLGATGVARMLMMPAGSGVSESLLRHLRGRTGPLAAQPLPELEQLDMKLSEDASDSVEAVKVMADRGVAAIVVLGGDGTHRVVAKHCGDIPLCTLSTGTNNAFPQLREATVAGLATGLVVTGRLAASASSGLLRREKRLDVTVVGAGGDSRFMRDSALVDVALTTDRWIGARAVWRATDLVEAVIAFTTPTAVGLSAVAAALHPVSRAAQHAIHLVLAPPGDASTTVTVPLAPGLVTEVGVVAARKVHPGQQVALSRRPGSLALDGEREIELGPADSTTVEPTVGPLVIDVEAVMTMAATEGVMNGRTPNATRSLSSGA